MTQPELRQDVEALAAEVEAIMLGMEHTADEKARAIVEELAWAGISLGEC